MFTIFILLSSFVCCVHSFTFPRIPLWRSPLEAIVAQRTMFSVLNDRINDELVNDSSQVFTSSFHQIDAFYFTIFLFTLYWRVSFPVSSIDDVEVTKSTRRLTNMVLLIIYIIFIKDVHYVL